MKLRVIPVLITAAALMLTGCSGSSGDDAAKADCTVPATGSVSDSIRVTGDFGKEVKATFKTPLKVEGIQRTVLDKGDGETIVSGDTVSTQVTVFNGKTGDLVATELIQLPVNAELGVSAGWLATVECMPVGSRAVSTMEASEIAGEAGYPEKDVAPTDSVVVVADAIEIPDTPAASAETCAPDFVPEDALKTAKGTKKDLPSDYPEVTRGSDGQPTITFPKDFTSPTEFESANTIEGDGATVAAGDCVTVHYKGINQQTGEIFDESWARGAPTSFLTTKVIPGFTKALVGQKVGTQVVALIPPADGYGEAVDGQGSTGNIAFVVDILATTPADKATAAPAN